MGLEITGGRERLPAGIAAELEGILAAEGEFSVGRVEDGFTHKGCPVTLCRLDRVQSDSRPKPAEHFFVAIHKNRIAAAKRLQYKASGMLLKAHLLPGDRRHAEFAVEPTGKGIGGMVTAEAIDHAVERREAESLRMAIFVPNVENVQWARFHEGIGLVKGPEGLHVTAGGLSAFVARAGTQSYRRCLLRKRA